MNNNNNKISYIINIFISIIIMVLASLFLIYSINNKTNNVNGVYLLINAIILELFSAFYLIAAVMKDKIKTFLSIMTGLIIIFFIVFNVLVYFKVIDIKKQEVLSNFIGKSISEVIIYGEGNNIEIEYTYEYSDNILEGLIISQDILPNELLKNVKKLVLVVSKGPNYDKEIVMTNLIGLNVDDLLKFIKENYLNNVEINYEINESIQKDIIISQSIKGNMKRNQAISFVISLGSIDELVPIEIENYEKKSLFDTIIYLKRNGIKYEISYEYSDDIKKDYVITQNPNKGIITPNSDIIKLIVSKGSQIVVPDLLNMKITDIVSWINENNLKISFNEDYHQTKKMGEIISVNYKKDDIISDGAVIILTTSKGQLKLIDTKNLDEFKSWANNYKVNYSVKNEYNDTVPSGQIIRFSIDANSIIDFNKEIIVTVSNGKAIVVPNFVGKSKANITTTCKNLGLNCTFVYSDYSTTAKDIAVNQNVKANITVVTGTYIKISLSKGPALTFEIFIQSEWFGNSYEETLASLKSKLSAELPDVNFTFVAKTSNTGARPGVIHENSPIKAGYNKFTQGRTYEIWIIK